MPTVIKEDGLTVKVNTRDEHPPAHVHVLGSDWQVRMLIGGAATHWNTVFGRPNNKQIAAAEALVAKHLDRCNQVWEDVHG